MLAAWGSYTAGCHGNLMTGLLPCYGVENETVSEIHCESFFQTARGRILMLGEAH